jgi:hypothetical protein
MSRLRPLGTNLWHVEHDHFMVGFVHFPGRMVVVRCEDGTLVLHSVVPIDDALAEDIAALGPVGHIVAPNRLHHLHLAGAIARFGDAKVWAAPGLETKRRDIAFDAVLGATEPPWAEELEPLVLHGNSWVSEVVFHHRPSHTLIVTDLVFNIHRVANRWTRWLLRSVGAFGHVEQSRLWRFTTRDRDAMRRDIDAILDRDFDRVVMAHGDPLETDARAQLGHALRWMRRSRALSAAAA